MRPRKYRHTNARKTVIDGIEFPSKLEGYFYEQAKLLGFKFTMQPKFNLQTKCRAKEYDEKKGIYKMVTLKRIDFTPDFFLDKNPNGKSINVYVEIKGRKFPVYMLKKKLWQKQNPDKILAVLTSKGRIDKFLRIHIF